MNSTSPCNKISTSNEDNLFHLENVRGKVGEQLVQETALILRNGSRPWWCTHSLFLVADGWPWWVEVGSSYQEALRNRTLSLKKKKRIAQWYYQFCIYNLHCWLNLGGFCDGEALRKVKMQGEMKLEAETNPNMEKKKALIYCIPFLLVSGRPEGHSPQNCSQLELPFLSFSLFPPTRITIKLAPTL